MYQLAMSCIHANEDSSHLDSDSFVHGIADGITAVVAMRKWVAQVESDLGVTFEWTPQEDDDKHTIGMVAHFENPGHGMAMVNIDCSLTAPKDDPEEIARMLVVNAKFVQHSTPKMA